MNCAFEVDSSPEYLAFGIIEYWIRDEQRNQLLVLRRSGGQWVELLVHPPAVYRTRLLPGFEFDCGSVFDAAQAVS